MKKMLYPLAKPYLFKKAQAEAIENVLRSGWLTQGGYAKKAEQMLAAYNNVKYAFVLNSATSGLIAALRTLSLSKDDEVIIPSFSFPATANAVIIAGARPVFCDIDLTTYNIDPTKIEGLITKRTRAIMPVHEFGLCADMKTIKAIANRYRLSIIEDAACSLGAECCGQKAGTLGDIGVFSFHPRKIVTSGEGGCLITNSKKIARGIESIRNHGEYKKRFINYGYNFRLSDILASFLLPQLEQLERLIKDRIGLAFNYTSLLRPLVKMDLIRAPACPPGCRHIYQSYVILLSKFINRERLKGLLAKAGIETQFGTYCLPSLDFYRRNFRMPKDCYRNSYYAYKQTLALPFYNGLKRKEQACIAEKLTRSLKKCVE